MTTHCMAKANAGVGGRHGCTQHSERQVDQVTDIPRPYAHMQADELADEITVARECIATTRDLRLRKQMQGKLKELIAEEGRRFTEGLPF